MFGDLIVPLDGSEESARAMGPASAIARYLDATMHVVSYHGSGTDGAGLRLAVDEQLRAIGDVRRTCTVRQIRDGPEPAHTAVADHIMGMLVDYPASLIVMASHGKGRTGALVGSVTTDLLRRSAGPVLLVGPACVSGRFRLHGPLLVPTDNSDHADAIVPIVEAFSTVFDFEPEVITVHSPAAAAGMAKARMTTGSDLPPESVDVHRVAEEVSQAIGSPVEYEVLHGKHPSKAIVQRATERRAALIAMATHAAAGKDLLTHGSVTASTVAGAPCPVLAYRPLGVA